MNIYRSEDIKRAVPLVQYFTDQNIPLSSGNRRAVATWRGGTHPSISIDLDKQLWNDHVTGEGGSVIDAFVKIEGGTVASLLEAIAAWNRRVK